MIGILQRLALRSEDWMRHSRLVRGLVRRWTSARVTLNRARSPQALARSIRKLCACARLAHDEKTVQRIQSRIHKRLAKLNEPALDWSEWIPDIDDPRVPKAAILKPYSGPREKGVVFVSFENQWVKLLRHGNLDDFAARYHLVIAPSSSPHNLVNYVFASRYPGPIFTLISNPDDPAALAGVSAKFIVLPLYASQWVNPRRFQPLPRGARDIDLLMVASFGKVKRHHAFFRALRQMPARLRVVLIGQDQEGRSAATIEHEARCFGVQGRFELRSNQSYSQVVEAFCRARASVVLSRREGSCVVVTESMFADTPAALLDSAQIGSRVFINDQTGRFLREADLAGEIMRFHAEADRYSPRTWAEENISCFHSSQRLNAMLREYALKHGEEWTEDLAALEWCPDPLVVEVQNRHRFKSERQAIMRRFQLEIGPDCPEFKPVAPGGFV